MLSRTFSVPPMVTFALRFTCLSALLVCLLATSVSPAPRDPLDGDDAVFVFDDITVSSTVGMTVDGTASIAILAQGDIN